MSGNTQSTSSTGDTIKILLSLMVLVGGIWGFYHYEQDYVLWQRALALIGVAIIGMIIAAQAAKGRALLDFFAEARVELNKVIWPTRTETLQTTLIVLVVVILVGIFLAILDMIFTNIVAYLVTPGAS